jgi:uncharacterized Tic20 family protein
MGRMKSLEGMSFTVPHGGVKVTRQVTLVSLLCYQLDAIGPLLIWPLISYNQLDSRLKETSNLNLKLIFDVTKR